MDLGAKVSCISSGFCKLLTQEVHPLGRLLELEGTGDSAIPYLGYIEVNLQISGIKGYDEDILLLVILTMTYSEKVLVIVGPKIKDRAMGIMTKGELARETMAWKQAHFGVVMSGLLQLPYTDSKEEVEMGKEVTPSPSSNPTASRGFCLDDIWGPVCTAQKVTVPPFGTFSIHGNTGVHRHCCRSMCLLNQHDAGSCPPLRYHLPPMRSYTWGLLKYQFA